MKTYENMADLVRDASGDKATGDELAKGLHERAIVHFLFGMRSAKGVSQVEMAKRLGCSQSRISKLENGLDDELTIGDFRHYIRSLDHDVMFVIRKQPWTLVEQIKYHASTIHNCLKKMVSLAQRDPAIVNGVSHFHVEAFYNLSKIVVESASRIPQTAECAPQIIEAGEEDEAPPPISPRQPQLAAAL
jgi:transcriptional regulator with XRE-family HTH domain